MSEGTYTITYMRDMPEDERPRERLIKYGPEVLKNTELLAIILRTGNARIPLMYTAEKLLTTFDNLRGMDAATVQELSSVRGIGEAKACEVKAAFTLGKRLASCDGGARTVINSPQSAANLVMEELRYQKREHYRVLFLDTRHQVLGQQDISIGSLSASIVHPRETFKAAISRSSSAIILVHNHPSGDPTPSKEDIALTTRLLEAGELLGVPVLDHLIIGDGIFVSLKERGLM